MPIVQGMVELLPKGEDRMRAISKLPCYKCGRLVKDHVWPYWRFLPKTSWDSLCTRRKVAVTIDRVLARVFHKQTECEGLTTDDLIQMGVFKRVY